MRRDELEAVREQKKHLLAEVRSIGGRYGEGGAWTPENRGGWSIERSNDL